MVCRPRDQSSLDCAATLELQQLSAARTILVVDDEPSIRQLLGVILEVEGYRVLEAPDGYAALAIVAEQAVDLITLDVMMPGLDGWQVAELLDADARTSAIPRVMVSGKRIADLRSAPGARRAAALLSKPFDFAEITEIVAGLLASPVGLPHQRGPRAS